MLETAIVAARLAGQRAMEELNFIKASVKKSESELVTQTDTRCQQIIIGRIKENYPDHGFIAEEGEKGKMFSQPPRGSEAIWWVIDPLDGTHNYIKGITVFGVSIALEFKNEVMLGVIYMPLANELYVAEKGNEPANN